MISSDLYDEEDTAEERAARSNSHYPVGGGAHAREYVVFLMTRMAPKKGEVPQSYLEIKVGAIVAYTNNMPKEGIEWHSDGSKVTVEDPEPQDKVGTALKFNLFFLALVTVEYR